MRSTGASARLAASLLLAVGVLLTACGGGSPTTAPGQPSSGGGGGSSATDTPGGEPSGVTMRLVNVWATPTGMGSSVELRLPDSDGGGTLLTAAPGEVTDFVAIPKAQYQAGGARVEVQPMGGSDVAIGVGATVAGDRVTVIVYGDDEDGVVQMRLEPVWEIGEPYYGLPWPSDDPAAAILAVYAGPLLALGDDHSTITIRTGDGECLVSTLFGSPSTGGFGGTGANFFILPRTGSVAIDVSSQTFSDCTPIDPDLGSAAYDVAAGGHYALIPWGPLGGVQLLTLDMSAG